jgi:hypothetical protein
MPVKPQKKPDLLCMLVVCSVEMYFDGSISRVNKIK